MPCKCEGKKRREKKRRVGGGKQLCFFFSPVGEREAAAAEAAAAIKLDRIESTVLDGTTLLKPPTDRDSCPVFLQMIGELLFWGLNERKPWTSEARVGRSLFRERPTPKESQRCTALSEKDTSV